MKDLRKINLWNNEMKQKNKTWRRVHPKHSRDSNELKKMYRTVWKYPKKELINMASRRGPFIDQSQSLNLFMETPTIGKLSSMYLYAWKKGIKTTYYLRSRGATKINKTTVNEQKTEEAQALACSLENPESCESCS